MWRVWGIPPAGAADHAYLRLAEPASAVCYETGKPAQTEYNVEFCGGWRRPRGALKPITAARISFVHMLALVTRFVSVLRPAGSVVAGAAPVKPHAKCHHIYIPSFYGNSATL